MSILRFSHQVSFGSLPGPLSCGKLFKDAMLGGAVPTPPSLSVGSQLADRSEGREWRGVGAGGHCRSAEGPPGPRRPGPAPPRTKCGLSKACAGFASVSSSRRPRPAALGAGGRFQTVAAAAHTGPAAGPNRPPSSARSPREPTSRVTGAAALTTSLRRLKIN